MNRGKIIAPIISLGLLLVFYLLNIKWVAIPVIVLVFAFFFLVIPKLVKSRVARFNRESLKLLTTGKATEIPKLAKGNILIQLFGPTGVLDAKLGLAYNETGAFAQAIACFENALGYVNNAEKTALQVGLTKALFVTGDLAQSETEGLQILKQCSPMPELLVIIARSRIGLGKIDDKTQSYLNDAEKMSPTADVQLMIDLSRIEADLATGRKPNPIPEKADSQTQFIRAWIQLVRGLLRQHKGDEQGAKESLAKALKLDPRGFVAASVRERLTTMDLKEDQVDSQSTAVDPAIRRKKKKRR